jgi:hypothetical protein
MDEENVMLIYNGVFFRYKKEQSNSFAGKWIKLEIIMLSETSQTEEDEYHTSSSPIQNLGLKKKEQNE